MSDKPKPSELATQTPNVDMTVPRPQSVWKVIAPQLISLVNLSALLTILGFFTVHSYLSTITQLYTYNISVTQYLAAGISLFVALSGYLYIKGIVPLLPFIPWISLFVFVGLGAQAVLRPRLDLPHNSRLNRYTQKGIQFGRLLWRTFQRINWIAFIGLCILFSFVYGYGYYAQMPRMLGGGMPANVIVVFKEPQTADGRWPFPINPNIPHQSEKVQLLLELTDGVLVRDTSKGIPIIVKSEVIQAIIDATSTAAPTPLPPTTP